MPGNTGAADLKFLHWSRQTRQEFQIEKAAPAL
jgi:hypothetical protein